MCSVCLLKIKIYQKRRNKWVINQNKVLGIKPHLGNIKILGNTLF